MFKNSFKNEVWYTWFIVLMFSAFIWIINSGIDISEELISGGRGQYGFILVNELTATLLISILSPFLLWGFVKYPIRRRHFFRLIGFHLILAVLYGFCHTSLMIVSRKVVYSLFNWPDYQSGILIFRYLMEFQKQFPLYWFIYGIFSLLQYIRKNQERQLKTSLLEKQLSEARLQALKMHLNPHFLFNTLNMISSFMYENIEKADQMIVNLCDLLRQTLDTQDHQKLPLTHEIKILNLYLTIMKARFGDSLQTRLEIEESTESALFPVLLLQPLVENSIKYSSNRTDRIVEVVIISRKISDQLEIIIRDNGPGLSTEHQDKKEDGIGLQITQDRLFQLYGSDHTFTMMNQQEGGLEVCIVIPFTKEMGG